jgi:AraC-like DNA-binding protein
VSTVSAKVVRLIAAGAAAGGVDPDALSRAAGVDASVLADPDGRVPRSVEARCWLEAARLTGDDCFGLHLSETLPVDGLGPIGFAVRSSATVGDAYERVIRYLRLLAQGPVLRLSQEGAAARLWHVPPEGFSPPRHAVEFLIANLVVLVRHGVSPDFAPRAVRFRHAAPASTAEHRRLLGPTVEFEAEQDELVIDRAVLSARQIHAEPALSEILDQHLSALAAALPPDGSFLERARAALAAEVGRREPTLESIAGRLRMSPRSLQRRLQQEGTSLTALLDRVRQDLAVYHLGESRESIAEVAFLLGFSEVSTFHRAFKRWTGVTPAAYRRGGAARP